MPKETTIKHNKPNKKTKEIVHVKGLSITYRAVGIVPDPTTVGTSNAALPAVEMQNGGASFHEMLRRVSQRKAA